jgi:Lrp/AsnC family leucine-responsive transcriptional regulator
MKIPSQSSVETTLGSHLDAVDEQILQSLIEDARLSIAALARRVGLSAPSTRDRVRRLEEAGVIRGYQIDIDPAALGLPISVWVRIRPGPQQLPKVAALARSTPEVSECHRISGEDCFLLRVHVPSIEAIGDVLDRFLPHGQTVSTIVVNTPVPPRNPRSSRNEP